MVGNLILKGCSQSLLWGKIVQMLVSILLLGQKSNIIICLERYHSGLCVRNIYMYKIYHTMLEQKLIRGCSTPYEFLAGVKSPFGVQ